MTLQRSLLVSFAAFVAAGCGNSATAEFGAARTLPKAQRPTVWDAPAKDRLMLPEVGKGKSGPGAMDAQDPATRKLAAETPPGWTQLPAQPERFRHLLWRVGEDITTECYVTVGVGGGVAGNIARWYGQFGENDVPAPNTLPEVEFFGAKGRLVELFGTFGGKPGFGMLLAYVADGDRMTTLKFTGPEAVVKQNRPQFLQLAKSVRFGDGAGTPAGAGAASAAAGGAATEGAGKQFVGTTPVGWEQLPPQPERFRPALWRIAGEDSTECYVSGPIGGGVGGNMARWYGQFGLKDVPAIEALEVVELLGRPGRLVELYGTFGGKPAFGMLLAFLADGDQVTSLKFTGPEVIVKANRDRFLALAKSLRSAAASPNPKAPPIQSGQPMPADHPPTGAPPTGAPPSTPPAATGPFTGQAPAGWAPKAGSSKFLHHTFGNEGEAYVGQLGGGLKATLDIWRGEMGLAPMSDAEFAALPKVAFLGEDSSLLELAGDFRSMSGKQIGKARMLVAARQEGSTIQFVKLVGGADDVGMQADAFRTFCASVRRAQ